MNCILLKKGLIEEGSEDVDEEDIHPLNILHLMCDGEVFTGRDIQWTGTISGRALMTL